jgi:hypothetical protein
MWPNENGKAQDILVWVEIPSYVCAEEKIID